MEARTETTVREAVLIRKTEKTAGQAAQRAVPVLITRRAVTIVREAAREITRTARVEEETVRAALETERTVRVAVSTRKTEEKDAALTIRRAVTTVREAVSAAIRTVRAAEEENPEETETRV